MADQPGAPYVPLLPFFLPLFLLILPSPVMTPRPVLAAVLSALLLAACSTTDPATAPPPDDTPETEPVFEPAPEGEPEPDPLYELTEDELRVAFTDGLFGLYRAEVDPSTARRLDRAEVDAWLTDLALASPRAVEFAHETLGPVLDQRYLVGFVLPGAAAAECASVRDVLYIPVPERFQGPERPFDGFIVQDACGIAEGELARFCTGGYGETDDGTSCSCVCTTGEAPGLECVSCGD